MNPRRVYNPLGFITSPLDQCRTQAMNPRRVYNPLGFIRSPLHQRRTRTMNPWRVYMPLQPQDSSCGAQRARTLVSQWAGKEGWLGIPPLSRVSLLLHVTTAPEGFEHKHRTFNAPTLGDVGSRVGDAQFWGVFGNPVWARTPLGTPPPGQEGGLARAFLGRKHPPPLLDPFLGRNPPSWTLPMTLPVPRQ